MAAHYIPSQPQLEQINKAFKYHPPHGDQAKRYEHIREEAGVMAELFAESCPQSRELSLALTHLEQAVMWANAAIARNEPAPVPGPPNPPRPERPTEVA